MGKTISREAAVTNLKSFFEGTDANSITPSQIFAATGRTNKPDVTNSSWLYNKLSVMREHRLFKKKFTIRNNTRAIEMIMLTPEGIKALGRDTNAHSSNNGTNLSFPLSPTAQLHIPDVVTLQYATEVTDAFNRQDRYWEWRLVRKEEAKESQ